MGRKPKLTDHEKREALRRRNHGEETLAEIGRSHLFVHKYVHIFLDWVRRMGFIWDMRKDDARKRDHKTLEAPRIVLASAS